MLFIGGENFRGLTQTVKNGVQSKRGCGKYENSKQLDTWCKRTWEARVYRKKHSTSTFEQKEQDKAVQSELRFTPRAVFEI